LFHKCLLNNISFLLLTFNKNLRSAEYVRVDIVLLGKYEGDDPLGKSSLRTIKKSQGQFCCLHSLMVKKNFLKIDLDGACT